jgi:hypothetical protein
MLLSLSTSMPSVVMLTTVALLGGGSGRLLAEGRIAIDSIEQKSPPGAIAHDQTLIIETDRFGNQRELRIGHPGGTVTRAKPCTREDPGPVMDCVGKDLSGVDWGGADLEGGWFDDADLRKANLAGAHLANASFSAAKLNGADLHDAALPNADFSDADLSGTNMGGANLINATFMSARLGGADFTGANIINAEFMDAELDGTRWVDGLRCQRVVDNECRR